MSSYKQFRDVHLWVGLIVLPPILLTAVTGLLWNHEKALGLKPEYKDQQGDLPREDVNSATQPLISTVGAWSEYAASIDQALAAAQQEWGDAVALEKIELKQEPGYGLIVKVKAPNDSRVVPEEVVWSIDQAKLVSLHQGAMGKTDWAKLVHELHTGKFFSRHFGFLWSDSGAAALLLLGATGVVLYSIPIFKKRAKKQKPANIARVPSAIIPVANKLESAEAVELAAAE